MKDSLKSKFSILFYRFDFPDRLIRGFFSLKTLRRVLMALAIFSTLVAVFYLEENIRGKLAWNQYVRQAEARGVTFDIMEIVPEPVPDDENFAMIPFFQELFDFETGYKEEGNRGFYPYYESGSSLAGPELEGWKEGRHISLESWQSYYRAGSELGLKPDFPIPENPRAPAEDVLLALSGSEADLAVLKKESSRKYSRFPVHYEDYFDALFYHVSILQRIERFLILRSLANLSLDNIDDAFEDVKLTLYIRDAIKSEPSLVSQLVRSRLHERILQPVWEGIAEGKWNEQQLAEMQNIFVSDNWIRDLEYALQAERAARIGSVEKIRKNPRYYSKMDGHEVKVIALLCRWLPSGWIEQSKVSMETLWDRNYPGFLDGENILVHVAKLKQANEDIEKNFKSLSPYNLLTVAFLPALPASGYRFAESQASSNQAAIACAIERYRLKTDSLPEILDLLVPEFIDELPHDVITGEPLIYDLISDSEYLLYSVGRNQIDDSGIYSEESREGDWVWHYKRESQGD